MTASLGVFRQYVAGTTAAISVFIAGSWLGWPSPAVRMLTTGQTYIAINADQISWVVSLMDLGNVLSPIPSGYMSNYFGRKNTLISTAFLYLLTWLLTIFGTSATYLYAARIGAGIGKGIAFTVVPMYLGEIAGVKVRGAVSTIFTALLYGGTMFEYGFGTFLSYQTLNIISGIVPLVFFATFIWMPESPYYLLMKNNQNEARKSLAWFRDTKPEDDVCNKELEEMKTTVQKEMEEKGSFKDLIKSSSNRKAMGIVVFLSSFQRLGGISPLLAYTVVTLPETGGWFKPDVYMLIFGVLLIIGNFIVTPLIDSLGRKPLLLISCAGCAASTGISGIFYYIAEEQDISSHNWIPYACFVSYSITYSLGIGIIPSTYVGELFPTNVKSYASSIGAIFFAIASFTINKIYLGVKQSWGVHYMFGLFTLCSVTSVVFTTFMVFETKGKTFNEIQNKLKDTNDKKHSLPERY